MGRGAGLGNPGFVPVAISDFIYAAIAEETGLVGTVGLLAIFGMIITRGIRASLHATDGFRRFLAAGITAYFGIQAILIVGGKNYKEGDVLTLNGTRGLVTIRLPWPLKPPF